MLLEEHVPVITTGAGMPDKYMKEWVPAGIKVVPVVPSVARLRAAWAFGATAVIARAANRAAAISEMSPQWR